MNLPGGNLENIHNNRCTNYKYLPSVIVRRTHLVVFSYTIHLLHSDDEGCGISSLEARLHMR